MDTIKNTSKDFWQRLDGNKTWILLSIGTVLQQAVQYDLLSDSKGVKFSIGVCIALSSLTIGDKIIRKNSFSKKNH